ncbi:MAG: FKBP-type peptidyl-prolyl cis-trans isomerase [Bacteroidales bacterium]
MFGKKFHLIVPVLVSMFLAFGCSKDKESQADKDESIIQQYLSDHNEEATRHSTGVYYHIIKEGSGYSPGPDNTARVIYKGWLTDGTVFDESAEPLDIPVSQVIAGWQVALSLLKPGGKGRFYIPSGLAYGESSPGSIPPNSVLIFDIELVDFY